MCVGHDNNQFDDDRSRLNLCLTLDYVCGRQVWQRLFALDDRWCWCPHLSATSNFRGRKEEESAFFARQRLERKGSWKMQFHYRRHLHYFLLLPINSSVKTYRDDTITGSIFTGTTFLADVTLFPSSSSFLSNSKTPHDFPTFTSNEHNKSQDSFSVASTKLMSTNKPQRIKRYSSRSQRASTV